MSDDLTSTVCPLCADPVSPCDAAVELVCLSCGSTRYHVCCAEKYAFSTKSHGSKGLHFALSHRKPASGLSHCPKGNGRAVLPLCRGRIESTRLIKQQLSEAKKAKKLAASVAGASSVLQPPPRQQPPRHHQPQLQHQHQQHQYQQPRQAPDAAAATAAPSRLHADPRPGTSAAAAGQSSTIPGADYVVPGAAKDCAGAPAQLAAGAAPAASAPCSVRRPQQAVVDVPRQALAPRTVSPAPTATTRAHPPQPLLSASSSSVTLSERATKSCVSPVTPQPSSARPHPAAAASAAAPQEWVKEQSLPARRTSLPTPDFRAPSMPLQELPRDPAAPSAWVTDLARYNQLLLGLSGGAAAGGRPLNSSGSDIERPLSVDGTMPIRPAPPAAAAFCTGSGWEEEEDCSNTAALLALCLGS